jgi:hypothetical protein
VQRDLELGYVSRATAERDYAVVVSEWVDAGGRTHFTVDEEKTALTRSERSRDQEETWR